MKKLTKTLLFAFASLFLTSSLFAATIHEGDAAQKSFELTANKQYGDNYETQNNVGVILPKEYEAKAGDKITIHVEGTVTNDIVVGERKGESSPLKSFLLTVLQQLAIGQKLQIELKLLML